ncbi:unnamed protein product [Amoebophrya sp. A25]|nr:unnamed protein product [Amoebophrya sp. A25]|eukprot:GSA25T00009983001.1
MTTSFLNTVQRPNAAVKAEPGESTAKKVTAQQRALPAKPKKGNEGVDAKKRRAFPERPPVPEGLLCPLSGLLMQTPVLLASGHIFELDNIREYVRQHGRNPISGDHISNAAELSYRHVRWLRDTIVSWRKDTLLANVETTLSRTRSAAHTQDPENSKPLGDVRPHPHDLRIDLTLRRVAYQLKRLNRLYLAKNNAQEDTTNGSHLVGERLLRKLEDFVSRFDKSSGADERAGDGAGDERAGDGDGAGDPASRKKPTILRGTSRSFILDAHREFQAAEKEWASRDVRQANQENRTRTNKRNQTQTAHHGGAGKATTLAVGANASVPIVREGATVPASSKRPAPTAAAAISGKASLRAGENVLAPLGQKSGKQDVQRLNQKGVPRTAGATGGQAAAEQAVAFYLQQIVPGVSYDCVLPVTAYGNATTVSYPLNNEHIEWFLALPQRDTLRTLFFSDAAPSANPQLPATAVQLREVLVREWSRVTQTPPPQSEEESKVQLAGVFSWVCFVQDAVCSNIQQRNAMLHGGGGVKPSTQNNVYMTTEQLIIEEEVENSPSESSESDEAKKAKLPKRLREGAAAVTKRRRVEQPDRTPQQQDQLRIHTLSAGEGAPAQLNTRVNTNVSMFLKNRTGAASTTNEAEVAGRMLTRRQQAMMQMSGGTVGWSPAKAGNASARIRRPRNKPAGDESSSSDGEPGEQPPAASSSLNFGPKSRSGDLSLGPQPRTGDLSLDPMFSDFDALLDADELAVLEAKSPVDSPRGTVLSAASRNTRVLGQNQTGPPTTGEMAATPQAPGSGVVSNIPTSRFNPLLGIPTTLPIADIVLKVSGVTGWQKMNGIYVFDDARKTDVSPFFRNNTTGAFFFMQKHATAGSAQLSPVIAPASYIREYWQDDEKRRLNAFGGVVCYVEGMWMEARPTPGVAGGCEWLPVDAKTFRISWTQRTKHPWVFTALVLGD